MTWITYKRDGKFYTKQRRRYGCEPFTETELDHSTWLEVQRTGEYTPPQKEAKRGKKQSELGGDAAGE